MRKARNEALKEIKVYEEEMKKKNDEKITEVLKMIILQLLTFSSDHSKLEREVKEDIGRVEILFNRNKDSVIDFLIDHVKYVDITVPEVVKGNFDAKFANLV